jgi:peptidoglycan-associated lipoprotein
MTMKRVQRRKCLSTTNTYPYLLTALLVFLVGLGCSSTSDRPPATPSGAPPPLRTTTTTTPPVASTTTPDLTERDEESLRSMTDPDDIYTRSLEDINAEPPLDDIHFNFDSAGLSDQARSVLGRHAEWLLGYSDVNLLIEGHCDERGTVEYNLALGERRANAAYSYLMSLGVVVTRLKTISYGKEFPFDPNHTEAAWGRNRRAHFELTAK